MWLRKKKRHLACFSICSAVPKIQDPPNRQTLHPASDITTSSAYRSYSIHDTFNDYLDAAKAQVFFFFRDGFRGLTDRCGVGPGRILPEPGKILHSLDVGSTSIRRNSTGEKQRYERCGTAIRTSTPLRGPLHHLACLQLPLSPVTKDFKTNSSHEPEIVTVFDFILCSNQAPNV